MPARTVGNLRGKKFFLFCFEMCDFSQGKECLGAGLALGMVLLRNNATMEKANETKADIILWHFRSPSTLCAHSSTGGKDAITVHPSILFVFF